MRVILANMKNSVRIVAVVTLAIALIIVSACASGGSTSENSADAAITSKVKTRLASDPEINPFRIDVDTNASVVTLNGTVKRESQREEAEKLAETTTGVLSVVNEISVGDKAFSETTDDVWITTKITSKLTADPEINPFTIDVDCHRGVVTLTGSVNRASQRIEVEKHATETKGVRKVVNKITVK